MTTCNDRVSPASFTISQGNFLVPTVPYYDPRFFLVKAAIEELIQHGGEVGRDLRAFLEANSTIPVISRRFIAGQGIGFANDLLAKIKSMPGAWFILLQQRSRPKLLTLAQAPSDVTDIMSRIDESILTKICDPPHHLAA